MAQLDIVRIHAARTESGRERPELCIAPPLVHEPAPCADRQPVDVGRALDEIERAIDDRAFEKILERLPETPARPEQQLDRDGPASALDVGELPDAHVQLPGEVAHGHPAALAQSDDLVGDLLGEVLRYSIPEV